MAMVGARAPLPDAAEMFAMLRAYDAQIKSLKAFPSSAEAEPRDLRELAAAELPDNVIVPVLMRELRSWSRSTEGGPSVSICRPRTAVAAAMLLLLAGVFAIVWYVRRATVAPPDAADARRERVIAAEHLSRVFDQSRTREFGLVATAAGRGCDVLIIHANQPLTGDFTAALQHGGPGTEFVSGGGGVGAFAREQGFRGVVYVGRGGQRFAYGGVTADETRKAVLCR